MVKVWVGRHGLQAMPQAMVGCNYGRSHGGEANALPDGGFH